MMKDIKMSTVNMKMYMGRWGQGHTLILPSHLKNSIYMFPYASDLVSARIELILCPVAVVVWI